MDFWNFFSSSSLGISGYAWIGSLLIVALFLVFLREKVGLPFPNVLMRAYSRPPLLLTSLWTLRAIIIFLLSILLLSNVFPPRASEQAITTRDEATVIALDISKSMETDDLLPSRIEFAKSIIRDHSSSLGNIGLVIFAGKTFVLSPITRDTNGLNYLIETLSTDIVNQSEAETSGTNIGDALLQSATLFDSTTKDKQIILITDGRANIGLDPLIASEAIRAQHIPISILALGSASDIPLTHVVDGKRVPLLDGSGDTINGSVDIETLSRIASMSSGSLVHIAKDTLADKVSEVFGTRNIPEMSPAQLDVHPTGALLFALAILALVHLLISIIFWIRYKTP